MTSTPRTPTSPSIGDQALLVEHILRFEALFGSGTRARAFFAPGRVNLMGAHLDYNGGPVMPTAIDRGTFLAVRNRGDDLVSLRSTHEARGIDVRLNSLPERRTGGWTDYPLGVVRELVRRQRHGGGLEILFGGNLPVGAGLSSSASICVGTALAVSRAWSLQLDADELVSIALAAEREFVGVHCGIMDPNAVGLARAGQILWLDCRDGTHEHLPLDPTALRIAVADSGVRRELAQSAFNQRVAEARAAFEVLRPFAPQATCLRDIPRQVLDARRSSLEPVLAARAEHVVGEVERTFKARDALLAGDLEAFGRALISAHASLRDRYQVSCPELDCLVEAAVGERSVLGARLTGAGFGGCVVILVRADVEDLAFERIADRFERRFGRRPGIELFQSDPGPREILV